VRRKERPGKEKENKREQKKYIRRKETKKTRHNSGNVVKKLEDWKNGR